ncbi:GNAT family N-acetyltransferase [Neorhodopirellula pilleata]|uniref:BioF2-like acetyltransferase domain-containing protein n=1 Tax=Neorhodopirellula pilleata TaxID=2714738 RepID=A0A5C5ZYJ5_9BACT|nr:GNAT family N-acetyltransferase [Neorhodopirellula pilleata]TWT91363.1 hypothetical protein Pla100_52110 [Neorhodopirellula pilleata]
MDTTPVMLASSRLDVVAHSAESLLNDRADEWDRLAGGVPFRQSMWLRPLWQRLGHSKQSCFLTVRDGDGRIRGILPLERFGSRGWQTIGSAPCTDHVSVLCRQSDRHIVIESLATFLITQVHDRELGWDCLHFEGVIGGDPAISELLSALDRQCAYVRIGSRMSVWFRSTDETWQDFISQCSRKHRHRLRQLLRQLESVDDGMRVTFPADETELAKYVNELIRLHQVHWQSQAEPGSYAADEMIHFIHDVALNAFRQERLFLPVLIRADPATGLDDVLAVQLHLIGDDGRLYCYSTGVNYEYSDRKPGNTLNAFVLRYAHENNFAGIDFMRGDEEYKSRIQAEPTPLLNIDVFAPTRIGRLKLSGHDISLCIKQSYRQLRNRPLNTVFGIDDAFDSRFRSTLPLHIDPIELNHKAESLCDDAPVIYPIGEYAIH